MRRLGLALPHPGLTLAESVDLAVAAEAMGYDDVWSSEIDAADGLTPLAAVAARTTRLRIGVAVVPATNRPPPLLAMTAASLRELSGDRFVLGIGSSTRTIVEDWMGGDAGRPLERVRETVDVLRAAWTGQRVSYAGQATRVDGFRLKLPPGDVPVYLGAMGPRMTALAGREADGLLLSFTSAEAVPGILANLRAAGTAAGRDPDRLDVVGRVTVAWGENGTAVRDQLRRLLAAYAVVPVYAASFTRQGFGAQTEAAAVAWAERDFASAARAIDDDMLTGLCVLGSAARCRDRLGEYWDAGVRTLVVSPVSGEAEAPDKARARLAEIADAVGSHKRATNQSVGCRDGPRP